MTVHGIDVSDAQCLLSPSKQLVVLSDAQWEEVAKKKTFVYLESQIGNDGPSRSFVAHVASARRAGMVAGAYLFAECLPNDGIHPHRDPEGQAQLFFEASGGLGGCSGELPPVIDLEDPPPERWGTDGVSPAFLEDWSGRCAVKVKSLFGREPMIYIYKWWADNAKLVAVGSQPLWLAVYGGAKFRTVAPWASAAMLQVGAGTFALPNGLKCDEDECEEEVFAQLIL